MILQISVEDFDFLKILIQGFQKVKIMCNNHSIKDRRISLKPIKVLWLQTPKKLYKTFPTFQTIQFQSCINIIYPLYLPRNYSPMCLLIWKYSLKKDVSVETFSKSKNRLFSEICVTAYFFQLLFFSLSSLIWDLQMP